MTTSGCDIYDSSFDPELQLCGLRSVSAVVLVAVVMVQQMNFMAVPSFLLTE
jgi:hypothetical protein